MSLSCICIAGTKDGLAPKSIVVSAATVISDSKLVKSIVPVNHLTLFKCTIKPIEKSTETEKNVSSLVTSPPTNHTQLKCSVFVTLFQCQWKRHLDWSCRRFHRALFLRRWRFWRSTGKSLKNHLQGTVDSCYKAVLFSSNMHNRRLIATCMLLPPHLLVMCATVS